VGIVAGALAVSFWTQVDEVQRHGFAVWEALIWGSSTDAGTIACLFLAREGAHRGTPTWGAWVLSVACAALSVQFNVVAGAQRGDWLSVEAHVWMPALALRGSTAQRRASATTRLYPWPCRRPELSMDLLWGPIQAAGLRVSPALADEEALRGFLNDQPSDLSVALATLEAAVGLASAAGPRGWTRSIVHVNGQCDLQVGGRLRSRSADSSNPGGVDRCPPR
jgi:hypothetical protein